MKLVHEVEKVARARGCESSEVAIGWLVAQSGVVGVPIVPIPGSTKISRLEQNARFVTLTSAELEEINEVLKNFEVKGPRAPESFAHLMEV